MIVGELLVDGTPRAGVRRIWPVTEAIKANLVEARRGRTQGEGRAAALADAAARSLPDARSARRLASTGSTTTATA